MSSDKVFQITLLISALTHGVILFQSTNFNRFSSNKKEEKTVVSYIKDDRKVLEYQKSASQKLDAPVKIPPKAIAKILTPPPFVEKADIFRKEQARLLSVPVFEKPALIKPDIIAIKKKITLPPLDIDKINNPSYLNYYQIVREKIRRAAYQNYTRTETGEIYLTFVISGDGYLKDIRFSEDKSSSSLYLKDVALRSVNEASPFPAFPAVLDYPQLSFNIVISFEIE